MTDDSYTFRHASKADLTALYALELDAFGEPAYPIFLFRQAMDLWPTYLWVATHRNELAAYVMLAPAADNQNVLSLMSFGIATQHQGKGLGRRFLAYLQQELRQARPHLERVWLTVNPANTAALRLYTGAGFVQTAQEADYYGPDTDRIVLTWYC